MNETFEQLKKELEGTAKEFFLGKNVIAKIAIFLLFLGVLSFGQLAYVDWLNDVGRVIFIGVIGLISLIIGYYFEKRKSIVFNNVFYILGIFILLITNFLSHFTYDLISLSGLMIFNTLLTISSFVYFFYRRSEFIDGSLLVLYTIVSTIPLYFIHNIPNTLELIFVYVTLGLFVGITAIYWTVYYKSHSVMHVVMMVLFTYFINRYFKTASSPLLFNTTVDMIRFIYGVVIYLFLIGSNFTIMKHTNTALKTLFGLFNVVAISFLIIPLALFVDEYSSLHTISTIFSFLIVTFLVLHLSWDRTDSGGVQYIYLVFAILHILLLSLFGGNNGIRQYSQETYNYIIIAASTLFVILRLVKHNHSYGIAILLLFSINIIRGYLFVLPFSIMSLDNLDIFIPNFLFAIMWITTICIQKAKTKEPSFLPSSLLFFLLSVIPIIFTIIHETLFYEDILYAWVLVTVLIAFRYILDIPIFSSKAIDVFKQIVILKIVLVIFIANFYYFDHHFNQLDDVLFFLYTLLINGYIVFALYDLYHLTNNELSKETTYIVFFIIGAVIQSIWIHRYINVEFDKVILSSYFMIASSVGILIGFQHGWQIARKIGLGVIYFSLLKFFIYDFFTQDFTTVVRMITYFILGFTLLGISFLYSYLEKTYGSKMIEVFNDEKEKSKVDISDTL